MLARWASSCRCSSPTASLLSGSDTNIIRSPRSDGGRQAMAAVATAAAAASLRPAALVWFRRDLRLADHEPLHTAATSLQQHQDAHTLLLPFYCLDERELQPAGDLGLPRLGPHRLRLLLEASAALRTALQRYGSDLLWWQGAPEAAVGRLVALAAATGSTHVSLHHFMEPGRASAELEDEVAAAFAAAAAKHGLPSSVHRCWGCTLYHPEDLPYQVFLQAQPAMLAPTGVAVCGSPGRGSKQAAEAAAAGGDLLAGLQPQGQQGARGQPGRQQQQDQGSSSSSSSSSGGHGSSIGTDCSRPNQQQERFGCLPRVMSDFRRVVQAHAPVRPPLPAPRAAADNDSSGDCIPSSDDSGAAVLPPLPADVVAAAVRAGLLGAFPKQLSAVYAAAGAQAEAALTRWEELTGQCCAELAPAGSGMHDPRSALPFGMGEEQALRRLRYFLGLEDSDGHSVRAAGQPAPIEGYQDSRMQAVGVDSSAKLGAFLALGCLSPRTVYAEVMRLAGAAAPEALQDAQLDVQCEARQNTQPVARQEQQGEQQQARQAQHHHQQQRQLSWREPQRGDTWHWLLMHLGIRDHFIYSALREGDALERPEGFSGQPVEWRQDAALFRRWTRGETGLPFVDASLRELAATGYTSNRGRQNVASLLSKALGLDWRWGAEYFESVLADHDWALNRGNWAYNSGTGADPRDRRFCTVSQGLRYDPEAELVRGWVRQLAALEPAELVHQPWAAPPEALTAAGVRLGGGSTLDADARVAGGEQQQEQQPVQRGSNSGRVAPRGAAAAGAGPAAAAPAVAAEVAAAAFAAAQVYPLPIVDPATQISKGPRQKQKQAAAAAAQQLRRQEQTLQ